MKFDRDSRLLKLLFWALMIVWCIGVASVHNNDRFGFLTVDIDMASSAPGFIQIYPDDGQGFREPLSVRKPVEQTIGPAPYHLEIQVPKGLKSLRLDPINAPALIQIDRVVLSYFDKRLVFEGEQLSSWQPLQHLTPLPADRKGNDGRQFRAVDVDPMLMLHLPESFHNISTVEYLGELAGSYLPSYTGWLLMLFGAGLIIWVRSVTLWQGLSLRDGYSLHCFGALLPVVLFWILYHQSLGNWFSCDDPCHISYLLDVGIWPSFADPWKSSTMSNFTPLFFLSFGVDLELFGLDPQYYYWHHLISFSLTLLVLYIVLAHFLSPLASVFALCAFTASATSVEAANFLMERHYIEGLGLSAIGLLCFIHAVKTNRWVWSLAGGGLYLLAAIAKELYVPLVMVLPFIPLGDWRARLRMVAPYAVMAVVYVVWRSYMLGPGGIVGGYSTINPVGFNDIWKFPQSYTSVMRHSMFQSVIILMGLILFLWAVLKKWEKTGALVFVTAIAVVVPFLPVLPILATRYVLVFTLFLLIAMYFGLDQIQVVPQELRMVALLGIGWIFLIASVFSVAQHQNQLEATLDEYEARSHFLLSQSRESDLMVDSAHCVSMYLDIRRHFSTEGEGGIAFRGYDDICLDEYMASEADQKQYYDYINSAMVEIPTKEMNASCNRVEPEKELWIRMRYDPDQFKLSWEFGPYPESEGDYFFIGEGIDQLYRLKTPGMVAVNMYKPLSNVRLVYQDDSGWETISPELDIELSAPDGDGIAKFEWKRGKETVEERSEAI